MPIPKKYSQGTENFAEIESRASVYREVLLEAVEDYIDSCKFKVSDFDKDNYDLRRTFKDGGIYYLDIIRRLIKDE